MIRDSLNFPSTRSWRDIPQPVVPRAMSKEGRWRLVMSGLRVTAVVTVAAACLWGVWLVAVSVRENARAMPAVAKATPLKHLELRTDGVLDEAWLARMLALPKQASLSEIDLEAARKRLLVDDQVVNATLARSFPDRLIVQVSERSPVARVMVSWQDQQKALLVARDGVVYSGNGYDAAVLETLPWLDGVTLAPDGGRFRPIEGMEAVAELLAKARLEAEHLYNTWTVVSLARLRSDRRIEVHAKDDFYVAYFTTRDDYFRQLVKLNYINEQLVAAVPPGSRALIDLTLGDRQFAAGYADVPVTVIPPPADRAPAAGSSKPMLAERPAPVPESARSSGSHPPELHSQPALFSLPPSQPKNTQREL